MNEETTRQPLDDRKKTALLRYIAIMFAVAFLLVLFSLLSQMRDTRQTISELEQSGASALSRAEQLQQQNQNLSEETAALQEQIEALQKENDLLRKAAADTDMAYRQLEAERKQMQEELAKADSNSDHVRLAYEQLLLAMELVTPGSQEGNVAASRALETLQTMEQYLGEKALSIYHSLMEEGE